MMIGKIKQYRRIFTQEAFRSGRRLGVDEDGSRDWITLLATICADGSRGRAMLIYPSNASAVQDTWLSGVDPAQEEVSFTASASGWTNDALALLWLDDFDKTSRAKMAPDSRDYRLLIVDGHGSHVTLDFFEKCYQKRVILAVFPPHATHRLQPLDVGMFRPFAMKYSLFLEQWRSDRNYYCRFTKRDFYQVFLPAYLHSFTTQNILSTWAKSGIWPRDATAIVSVVRPPSRPSTAHSGSSTVSIHAYSRVRRRVRFVLDIAGIDDHTATMVKEFIDSYQTALSIAEHERDGFKSAMITEQKKQQRSKPLADAAFIEKHGKVMVWTPGKMKLKKELYDEIEAQQTAEELAKQEAKAFKAREKEDRQILAAQQRQLRQDNILQRKITREAAAEEKRLARQAQKEATTQLKNDLQATRSTQKRAPKKPITKSKPQKQSLVVIDEDNSEGPSTPVTTRTRRINLPKRFRDI